MRYKIVYHYNQYYLIDKEDNTTNIGDNITVYYPNSESIVVFYITNSKQQDSVSNQLRNKDCVKIIASTDKVLSLPKLHEKSVEAIIHSNNLAENIVVLSAIKTDDNTYFATVVEEDFYHKVLQYNEDINLPYETMVENYLNEFKVSPSLAKLLDTADSLGIKSITMQWEELEDNVKYVLSSDDADFITFHKEGCDDIPDRLMVNSKSTTKIPIYNGWYITVNYHA